MVNQITTQGYTNDTAIETRIVDLEVFDDKKHEDDDYTKELKEVRKEFNRHNKAKDIKGEESSSSDQDGNKNNKPESIVFNNPKE